MKNRTLALVTALVMALASVGVGMSLVSQASTETTTQTPKKCKKCKKVIKKAKKCKKSGSTSAKCKKAKKKARKCKKTLRSKQCKGGTTPSPKPSGSGGSTAGGQEVKGTIQQPAKFVDTQTGEVSCYAGKHRRGAVLTDGANQGVDGWHFDVDPKTVGAKFVLTADGGEGAPDLDITFYEDFGTVQQQADTAYAPPNQTFETRGPGGETGTVPADMKKAIVCLFDGANVPFTYTAGAGSGGGGGGGGGTSPSPSPSAGI
jgi:hypothetical protein